MINEALLICALSLPAANYPPIAKDKTEAHEIDMLCEWIQRHAPESEMKIIARFQSGGKSWERLPITWRDRAIWIKRPVVHDRRMGSAA